LDRKNIARYIT